MVYSCRSKLINVISGVPQGSVLGLLLFLLYTSEFFYILENKLIGYADDPTLMAVVPSRRQSYCSVSLIRALAGFVNGVTFGELN